MVQYQIPLVLNSRNNYTNDLGNQFTVFFRQPLQIPKEAKGLTIELVQAEIWNTIANISAQLNNNTLRYIDNGTPYDITIPDGLYDINQFNDQVNRLLVNAGAGDGVIRFEGDTATQRVVIQFTAAGQQVDLTAANSVADVIGFDSGIYPPAPTTDATFVIGQNTANFNPIDYYLFTCDLIGMGLNVNGFHRSVLSKVNITAPPGSQSVYQPRNPIPIPIQNRAGQTIERIISSVLDQDGNPLVLNEAFGYTAVIRYQM